jgi:hypothetical protein
MSNAETTSFPFNLSKSAITTLAVLGGLVVLFFALYGYVNSLRSEGVRRETALNAQYLSNQNELGTYISSFYEQLGIANLKSEKLDQILMDAVKGRYEGNNMGRGGEFFSAITEAYPNLQGLDIYDRIINHVAAGREAYKGVQNKLLDMLREYDNWRIDGFFQSWIISSVLGVPSEHLEARIGNLVTQGASARDQMYLIVLPSQARDAYKTGNMEPLKVR